MDDLLQYLKTVDALYFSKETYHVMYRPDIGTKNLALPWVPVVEVKDAIEPFLTDYPENLAKSYPDDLDIDVMFGYTSNEMLFYVSAEIANPSILKPFDEQFQLQLPTEHLTYRYDSKDYKLMANDIRNFYFGNYNGRVDEQSLGEYSSLLSDLVLVYSVDRSAKMHQSRSAKSLNNTSKNTLYKFSTETKISHFRALGGANERNIRGASHADDIFHIFKVQKGLFGEPYTDVYSGLSPDSVEVNTIRQMAMLWTNFAKFGNPDPITIKPKDDKELIYVEITNDGYRMVDKNPSTAVITFWDDFYKKYAYAFYNVITGQTARDEL